LDRIEQAWKTVYPSGTFQFSQWPVRRGHVFRRNKDQGDRHPQGPRRQRGYRITIPWWVFLLGGLSALLIALATVSYQSVKAALLNPVKSLRSE
jgi:type VI protein secretion system component VasF